ncbi:MAG: CBS domain-containing protein [Rhodocyclales bacterium]|nr:CBS domain-containing protein [Rhodocyclales bacterium]
MDTNDKPISQLMTRTVCEVPTAWSAAQILEKMQAMAVSSVLVVEDRLTLGIITERDVVRNLHRKGGLKSLSCTDLMQAPVVTVEQSEKCIDVYHLMDGRRIRHIAVTDGEGLLVGIVSEGDILRDFGVEHYMRFKDVGGAMSTDVVLLPETATVGEAVALMDERRQSCVFAVDAERRPLGVLSERDIVRLCHEHDDPQGLTLRETMKGPVRTTHRAALLHDVVKSMDEARIRRLAVVDDTGGVCGVLTHHEVVHGLEGQYVSYLKDMIQEQEKALEGRQAAVSEKRVLENILRSAVGTAVITTDLDGRVGYFSPAVLAMTKLQPFATRGRDAFEVLATLGWPQARQAMTPQNLANGRLHTQLLAWTADGQSCHAELQVSLLIDDKNQAQGYLLLAR